MKRILLTSIVAFAAAVGCMSFSKDNNNQAIGTAADGGKGFAVIELYTSEGCSSCPPADRFLKQIRDDYKGQQVYVLAYHVDYWNRLGWKDRFSDHRFSERQSTYANNFRSNQVYTPQAVVNGRDEMVGSAAGKLKNAITKYLGKNEDIKFSGQIGSTSETHVNLIYNLPVNAKNKDLVVNLIEKDVSTNVKAGENGGKVLPHANVVRFYQVVEIKSTTQQVRIDLPKGFKKEDYGVISFMQEKNQGKILGVAKTEIQSLE